MQNSQRRCKLESFFNKQVLFSFALTFGRMDYVSNLCINLMLLIPPIQQLVLLIRSSEKPLPAEPTSNSSLDAGFSCTEGT